MRGGGVAFLVDARISSRFIFSLSSKGFEVLFIDILGSNCYTHIRFVVVYLSPSSTKAEKTQLFKTIQNYLTPTMIITGDFNCPSLNWSDINFKAHPIMDISAVLGFLQYVTVPTRGSHILDLCFSNTQEIITSLTVDPGLSTSDHHSLLFKLKHPPLPKPKPIFVRDMSDCNLEKITPLISHISLTDQFYINEKFDHLCHCICQIMDQHLPLIKRNVSSQKCRYPSSIRQIVNQKLALFKLSKRSPCRYKSEYRILCYTVKRLIRNVHEQRLNKLSSSPSKFFKYIRSQTKPHEPIPSLIHQGKIFSTPQAKADLFASIFSQHFDNVPDKPPPSLPGNDHHCITDIDFDVLSVVETLKSLPNNMSLSPENLPYRLLRSCRIGLCTPLTDLFRNSLDSGHIPRLWHKSIILPLHKKNSKSDPTNYRPISITSTTCRVFERVISKSITQFLLKHKRLDVNQFGFLPKRSTVTQLISTLESWGNSLTEGKCIDCIYIDLRRAFDSVPHEYLLHKLHWIGIRGKLLRWIRNFLTERSFVVKIEDSVSPPNPIRSGVPQGSVLGPLLFIIYINDITSSVNSHTHIRMYADDIKIFSSHNGDSHSPQLQNSIDSLYKWCVSWALQISRDKTLALRILPKVRGRPYLAPTYSIMCTPIRNTFEMKDLGVLIHHKLDFRPHINSMLRGAYMRSMQIFQALNCKNPIIWSRAFKLYIRPLVEYASVVWNPPYKVLSAKIERLQKFFTRRALAKCHIAKCPYSKRLAVFKLESLAFRRLVNDLCLIHKICHNHTHINPTDILKFSDRPSRKHPFQIYKNKKSPITSNLFVNRCINRWNCLPRDLVSITHPQIFKPKLALYLKSFPDPNSPLP